MTWGERLAQSRPQQVKWAQNETAQPGLGHLPLLTEDGGLGLGGGFCGSFTLFLPPEKIISLDF